ncbi:hypothetical protein ABBQ32_011261 [Trebouxia sp. C0010 RCD-2024]
MWRHNILTQLPERHTEDDPEVQEDPRPFELNANGQSSLIEFTKDRRTATYLGSSHQGSDVGIQSTLPVPRQVSVYYFEMTVLEKGEKGRTTLGFTVKDSKLTSQPGWETNTYGYHGDDGKKYSHPVANSRSINQGTEYGPTYTSGDTVGAGLNLETQEIFFTKNGKLLGTAFRNVPPLRFYPTIGMYSRGESVSVNFGASTFAFDLQGQIEKTKQAQQEEKQSVSISPGATHHLVQDYLRYYGYGDTLQAYDRGAGLVESTTSTSGRPEKEAEQLATRQKVRQAIMAGCMTDAQQLLHNCHPDMLESVTHPNLDVLIFFHCLHFIELIREKRINDAIRFAQDVLSPLRGIMSHRSKEYDAMLHDTVALIAYEEPEESPMYQLLDDAQREVVADVVNAALLASASGKPKWEAKPQAHLEQILRQLVAVRAEKLECSGGQGEAFSLPKYLGNQQAQHDGVQSMFM